MDFADLVSTTQQEASDPTPALPPYHPGAEIPFPAPAEDPTPQVAGVRHTRQLPWESGGGRYYSELMANLRASNSSVREAMVAAGLDWNVELVTAYADWLETDGVSRREVPGYAVQRQDNGHILGIVGERYQPVQNRRLAEFTDTLIDTSNTSLAGMGEVRQGRKVFTVVRLDGDVTLNPAFPDEAIGGHLIVGNTHDGTGAMFASVMHVRWACSNGLISTVPGVTHTVKIRHTGDVEEKIVEAQRVLALATGYTERLVTIADEMLNVPMPDAQGVAMLESILVPELADDESNQQAVTRGRNVMESIVANWRSSDNLDNVRHTGWGLFNAVTEWDQHIRSRSARSITPMERLLNDSQHKAVTAVRDRVLALN